MSERIEEDMICFQAKELSNTIRIVVPINYGNGALVFNMRYFIREKHPKYPELKYLNHVGLVGVFEGHWINSEFTPKRSFGSAGLLPNQTVISSITMVLNYLKFVKELVEMGDHETTLLSFVQWKEKMKAEEQRIVSG